MAQEPSKPLSTWRITWEGLKLPTKNLKLILSILIITLFISSILYLAIYYSTYPLLFDIANNLHSTPPSPPKDLKPLIVKLIILQFFFTIVSFILSCCSIILTVNATAITYLTPQANLGEFFTRMKKTWKGALITQLLVGVLSFAYILLILVIVFFFAWITKNSLIFLLLGHAIELVLLFLYVREAIVWSFAVVISVIEDGYYGMKVIVRAKELIEGRRKQYMTITFLIVLTGGVIIGLVNATVGSTLMVGGLLMVILMKILNVMMLAAYTVFYYDCKKCRGEDMVLSMKEGFMYTSVPSDGYAKVDVV